MGSSDFLTKPAVAFFNAFSQTHIVVLELRLGPTHMRSLPSHSSSNLAYVTVLTVALMFLLAPYSPRGFEVGFGNALVTAVLSFAFLGFMGYLINVFSKENTEVDINATIQNATSRTNKWISYLCTVFFVHTLILLALNFFADIAFDATLSDTITMTFQLPAIFGMALGISLSGILASILTYLVFSWAGKIVDKAGVAVLHIVFGFGSTTLMLIVISFIFS